MATAKMAAQGHQQTGFGRRALALVVLAVATLGLAGCGGGGTSGLGPTMGFNDPIQGPTTLQFTTVQLGAFLSTGGNTPGAGG